MMASPLSVRLRLFPLWVAFFAFAMSENAMRVFALARLNSGNPAINAPVPFNSAAPVPLAPRWAFWWLFLSAVPAIVLAPLIGAAASSRHVWLGQMLAAIAGLVVVAVTAFADLPNWVGCIGLLSLTSAFFAAGRFADIVAVARQGQLPLPHVVALLTVAMAGGSAAGSWVGYGEVASRGMPAQVQLSFIGFGLAIVALLFARVRPDLHSPLSGGLVGPFARSAAAVVRSYYARNSLIAFAGVFIALFMLDQWLIPTSAHAALALAVVLGVILGGLHGNAFRVLGRVPFASIGFAACAIWAVAEDDWYEPALFMAVFLGAMIVPLLTTYQVHQPASTQGHGAALLFLVCGLLALGLIGILINRGNDAAGLRRLAASTVLTLGLVGAVFSWLVFFRPAMETTVEWLLWPIYRVRASGPGASQLPWRGPCIIIANHAAWFDPFWIAKISPAPIVPMMTSKYYDLPVIAWLMRKIVGTIRVPNVPMRKEAPEIQEVLDGLDAGKVIVVFPEGWLRRKESQELRRFGRGIWQILKARPNTPVFACWIDGNWGSFISHKGGPPTKNKRMDFWRSIRIAVSKPRTLDEATLETHLPTRLALMQACLEARAELGLPPIDPLQIPMTEEDEKH